MTMVCRTGHLHADEVVELVAAGQGLAVPGRGRAAMTAQAITVFPAPGGATSTPGSCQASSVIEKPESFDPYSKLLGIPGR
jgi:hypothetical protein